MYFSLRSLVQFVPCLYGLLNIKVGPNCFYSLPLRIRIEELRSASALLRAAQLGTFTYVRGFFKNEGLNCQMHNVDFSAIIFETSLVHIDGLYEFFVFICKLLNKKRHFM